MASSKDIRVLFVQYRPGATSHQSRDGDISQQKHAAREYHRKAKQRRQPHKQMTGHNANSTTLSTSSTSRSPEMTSVRVADPSTQMRHEPPICSIRGRAGLLPESPRNLLGARRVDPMNSLPISDMSSYAQEMLDISLTYQWSVFKYCNPGSTYEDMKRHVMSRILSSATSLCAIVFAGATYFALRRPQGEVTRENLMLRLNYKNRALRNMSEEIGELGPRVPTEALYTMLSLAAFGAAKTLQPPPYREHEPPLEVAHDPDFYCRLPCEWAHLRALSHLLKQRGGLTAVNRPGFGVALQLYDILASFQRLQPPAFPLLESTKQTMSSWPSPEEEPLPLADTLGNGFRSLSTTPAFIKLNVIIGHTIETTLGWDRYRRSTPDAPTLHQIVHVRNAIVHDLLCLPDISTDVRSATECLYELYRLGTLSYMLIFLHPLSKDNGPHDQLAKRLMSMLDIAASLQLWATDATFMLWVTVVGGIMAKENWLRHWYVEELNNSGPKYKLVAWPAVTNVLSNYLWLESEGGLDGITLWRETWAWAQPRAARV